MSYGLMTFAVDYEYLRGLFGRRDEELLAKMLGEMAEELGYLDEQERENEPELEEDDELPLPAAVALRHLLMGEQPDATRGHVYAYLVKEICMVYDEFLDNGFWCPISMGWVSDQFDPALHAAGVPKELFGVGSHLMFRGSPFPIPSPDDWPAMGYLTPDEIPPIVDLLEGIDPERFRPIDGHEQFAAVRTWLRKCRDTGRGLLGFYH